MSKEWYFTEDKNTQQSLNSTRLTLLYF